jgi:hypothetical protein
MKKRNLKSLQLSKKSIANLIMTDEIKGGETNTACSFTSNRLEYCCGDTLHKNW